MQIRRRRGCLAVSTIIANMLMILITLSLVATVVVWAGTSFGAFSGGSQLYFVQRQQALEEQFVIENVFLTKSQGYIDIFVRNTGASLVGVVAIYVNGIPENPTGASGSNGAGSCTIPSGGLVLGTASSSGVFTCNQTPNVADFNVQFANGFNANCPTQPWCTGDILYIVVASGKGNQATDTVGAP